MVVVAVAATMAVAPAASAAPSCGGRTPTIVGTSGDDELVGTAGRDVIHGLGGADDIAGEGGGDIVCGGRGEDLIRGNSGDDTLYGGSGTNYLFGGSGDDHLDTTASRRWNRLTGGTGSDQAYAGPGDDFVHGGLGRDYLDGGGGTNQVSFDWRGGRGEPEGVVVDLAAGTAVTASGSETILGFRSVVATVHVDVLYGTPRADVLDGVIGENRVFGRGGDDQIRGMGIVRAGAGDDRVQNYLGTVYGESGDDVLYGAPLMRGGGGNDVLVARDEDGADPADRLYGGSGRDVLNGGGGSDDLHGGDGRDVAEFFDYETDNGDDWTFGGYIIDLAAGTAQPNPNTISELLNPPVVTLRGIEGVWGSAYDDVIRGDRGANVLRGRNSDDEVRGRGGDDALYGGEGQDEASGGKGTDRCQAETTDRCER